MHTLLVSALNKACSTVRAVSSPILHSYERVWSVVVTLFLFTKSDLKTILGPITIFAIASAPLQSLSKLLWSMLWIWIHLLHFDVSNQTICPEEDRINKAFRPIPAGRITLYQAKLLRWSLIPICFGISVLSSLQCLYASMSLVLFTTLHNECGGGSGHWIIRNTLNAVGFASFEWGATLIAGQDPTRIDKVALSGILLTMCIIGTTVHAQDFKDVNGDKEAGRHTLPMLFPEGSRFTLMILLAVYSFMLPVVWSLDIATASSFGILGVLTGYRFMFKRSCRADQVSYYLYNIWAAAAISMPGYWNLVASR
ncbi:hypothetical protein D9758_017440 [Tetrapyrgos nigripes]|uniref:Uncharacterized protein n=1 Tax=Tetrapyrgos nigripes TaxID=182062 RepID=A0A8H5FFA2_9AGAR|nr:hypothetical protein D9758_017440 [Tetrapyrgos nigripes]